MRLKNIGAMAVVFCLVLALSAVTANAVVAVDDIYTENEQYYEAVTLEAGSYVWNLGVAVTLDDDGLGDHRWENEGAYTEGVDYFDLSAYIGSSQIAEVVLSELGGTVESGASAVLSLYFTLTEAATVFLYADSDTTQANEYYTVTSSSVSPTPIPSALLLLGSGLVGLVGLRRKHDLG